MIGLTCCFCLGAGASARAQPMTGLPFSFLQSALLILPFPSAFRLRYPDAHEVCLVSRPQTVWGFEEFRPPSPCCARNPLQTATSARGTRLFRSRESVNT